MSTREMAHRILDNMNDEQLANATSVTETKLEKEKAYEELRRIIRPVPGIDYDKELAEYREGKYEICL